MRSNAVTIAFIEFVIAQLIFDVIITVAFYKHRTTQLRS